MSDLPITGYADRLSVAGGEDIGFFISTTAPNIQAELIRPSRKGQATVPVAASLKGTYPGQVQKIYTGSHGVVAAGVPLPGDTEITLDLMPTLPASGREQGIMTWGAQIGLFLTPEGLLCWKWGAKSLTLPEPLRRNDWYAVRVLLNIAAGRIVLQMDPYRASKRRMERALELADSQTVDAKSFRLSGWWDGGRTIGCLNAKVAAPRLYSLSHGLIARWDFSIGQHSDQGRDIGPHGRHMRFVHHPRRASTGPRWRGLVLDFRFAPDEYDAVAFHHDDMTDAGWEKSLSWTVPDDLPSGLYALQLTCDHGQDHIPFIVKPHRKTTNKVAFLAPTFSYLAYANEQHWWMAPDIKEVTGGTLDEILSPGEKWAHQVGMLSCYDRHADGTGCVHSSWLRPIINMRTDYVHPYIRGPHQLSADMYILDWLRHLGVSFDVITDHDVHLEGADILRPYNVVLTGSHPEYVSAEILDAFDQYIHGGGNAMYLGGNGFHSASTIFPDAPHVFELRRAHPGGLHWKSLPGEAYHAATGEPGGLWILRDRSGHRTFGVGTASVIFTEGKSYTRTPESHDPHYDWVFEGLEGDTIGARCDLLGGAAGFEYDRMDPALGSPPETVRLASAEFDPPFTEFTLTDSRFTGCEAPNRADIVLIEAPGRGSVFAVGSVAYTSGLFDHNGDNAVAKLTANVLKKFSAG
jgi:N,N-dimethylformamidase